MSQPRNAVIIGASLAGVATAAAVAPYFDRVTVMDRHAVPDGPLPRRGVPQARHAHLLWSGGARAIDALLPGALDALTAADARQIGLPSDLVTYTAQGWMRRFPASQFIVTCSRDLLDWVLRQQLICHYQNVTIEPNAEAIGLIGDHDRITGVRLHDAADAAIPADLVIDASGRSSRSPVWLTKLGLPPVAEEVVDSGLAYSTRIFQAPVGVSPRFPMVNVQADPTDGNPGRTATIVPIENARWLVTLSGTKGGHPPADETLFVDFALHQVRDPIVGRLLANATPLTPVAATHGGGNRRCRFEKLPNWPDGYLVVGDAVASFNPVYGQGMSVAAQQANQLRTALERGQQSTKRIQAAICASANTPWAVATGQDLQYPDAIGPRPPAAAKLVQLYFERFIRTAAANPAAAAILYEAFTLSGPMRRLASPRALFAALRGPTAPELTSAPLTRDELHTVGLAEPAPLEPPHRAAA